MKITRENYEIFFIDYFDGKLSPEQVAELMLFLTWNPELKQEFDNFENITLTQEKIIYDKKSELKKIPGKAIIINNENFDEVCIAQIENDLTKAEESEFKKYLATHPDRQKDYVLYLKTKLAPDNEIVFENKSALKRFRVQKNYSRYIYAGISAAASVLIILYFYFNSADHTTINNKITATHIKNDNAVTNKNIEHQKNYTGNKINKKQAINKQGNSNKLMAQNFKKKTILKNTADTKKNADIKEENTDPVSSRKAVLLAYAVPEPKESRIKYRTAEFAPITNQEKEAYLTLGQIAKIQIKKIFTKKKEHDELTPNISFLDVADAAIRGINKMTGANMKLNKTYNSKGEISALAFRSDNFEVSRKIK